MPIKLLSPKCVSEVIHVIIIGSLFANGAALMPGLGGDKLNDVKPCCRDGDAAFTKPAPS